MIATVALLSKFSGRGFSTELSTHPFFARSIAMQRGSIFKLASSTRAKNAGQGKYDLRQGFAPAAGWETTTLLSQDPRALQHRANQHMKELANRQADNLMCLISRTLPVEILGDLIPRLQEQAQVAGICMIGGLIDSLPASRLSHGVSFAATWSQEGISRVAFRSTLSGRPKIALGREIKQELDDQRDLAVSNQPRTDIDIEDALAGAFTSW